MELENNLNVERAEQFDVVATFQGLNDELRVYLENAEKNIEIPRSVNSLINDSIKNFLFDMVKEFKPEGNCCFLVKNVSEEGKVCFVHKFTDSVRTFENIELSRVPPDVKDGDVLVLQDGKLVTSLYVTAEVLKIRSRIMSDLEKSIEDFQIEGRVYEVCDKSDDVLKPKMSLYDVVTGKEFWSIGIDADLHGKIEYGTKVKYENGRYVLA